MTISDEEARARELGLKEAQKDYAEFHRWVAGIKSAATMHSGMIASFENAISARFASLQPEAAKREEGV